MSKSVFLLSLLGIISTEKTIPIKRTVSDGVRSMGINILYGDEDLTVINQIVREGDELDNMKTNFNLEEALPPLPVEDVKCLISVDRHCSKDMLEMKNILIQALKEDCAKCSKDERERAGNVVASMMAHDPVAWKLFLTRSAIQFLPEKKPIKEKQPHFKIIGEPEIIESSKRRYLMPGVKVRVKRYAMEKIN